jgi:hypothetical protein
MEFENPLPGSMGGTTNPRKHSMKTITLLAAVGMLGALPLSAADVQASVVTSSGTLSAYEPGSSFVVKETSGPVTYGYAPQVTYVTRSGTVIPETELRQRLVVGRPVSVQYVTEGERRLINRVIVDDGEVEAVEKVDKVKKVEVEADDDDDD